MRSLDEDGGAYVRSGSTRGEGLPDARSETGSSSPSAPSGPRAWPKSPRGGRRRRDALAHPTCKPLAELRALRRLGSSSPSQPRPGRTGPRGRLGAPHRGLSGDGAERCFPFEEGTAHLWPTSLALSPKATKRVQFDRGRPPEHGGDPPCFWPRLRGHEALARPRQPENGGPVLT